MPVAKTASLLLCAMGIAVLGVGFPAGEAAELQVRFRERVAPAPPAEAVVLPEVAAAPLIDGKLDDKCWKNAWRIEEFVACGRPDGIVRRTAAFLCRDASGLYIAVRCIEPDPARVKATHRAFDEPLSDDDSVEVYLSLDGSASEVLRLAVNAAGTRQDARCLAGITFFSSASGGRGVSVDPSWDMTWRAGVRRGANAWTAEISILARNISGKRAFSPGEAWWIGIRRNRVGPLWPEWSRSSAFGRGDGRAIPVMRRVRMGKPGRSLEVRDPGALLTGKNRAILRLTNPAAKPAEVQVHAVVVSSRKGAGPSRLYGTRATVPAKGVKEIDVDYNIPVAAGACRVLFRLLDKGAKEEFASREFIAYGMATRLVLRPVAGRILARDPLRVELRLLTGNVEVGDSRLRLHLADAGGTAVAEWAGRCSFGRVSVVFPGGVLKPGRYELTAALLNGKGEEISRESAAVYVHDDWAE